MGRLISETRCLKLCVPSTRSPLIQIRARLTLFLPFALPLVTISSPIPSAPGNESRKVFLGLFLSDLSDLSDLFDLFDLFDLSDLSDLFDLSDLSDLSEVL